MTHWTKRIRRSTTIAGIAFLLAGIAVTGNAQTVALASRNTERPVAAVAPAPDITAAQVAASGEEIVKLVDQSRFADLWNSASTATRKVAQPAQFTSDMQTNRAPLGAPVARAWLAVSRKTLGAEKGDIAGNYLNIEYETRFARGDVKHELVSFRFDEDRVWRFAGYVIH